MFRLVVWLVWCAIGFCVFSSGCRAAITAEKLEASLTIQQEEPSKAPEVKVYYDKDSIGP